MSKEVSDLFAEFNAECEQIDKETSKEYDHLIAIARKREKDFVKRVKETKRLKNERDKMITVRQRSAMKGGIPALQDIYCALSGGEFRDKGVVLFGHSSKYYADYAARLEETFAQYCTLAIARPDLVKMLKRDKPELVKTLEELVKEMLKKAGK
jgi:hypothetical protein